MAGIAISDIVMAVAALVLAGVMTGGRLWAWRSSRRLAVDAVQVRIVPPPTVDVAGAVQFWTTMAAVVRGHGWRRWLGRPYVSFELRWSRRQLTVAVWVPRAADAHAVATVAGGAWPSSTVTVEPAAPAHQQGVAAGGGLVLALAHGLPLQTKHETDPLRQLVAAGTRLSGGDTAVVQILARPAAGWRVGRLATAGHGQPGRMAGWRWLADLLWATPRPRTVAARPDDGRARLVAGKLAAGPHWQTSVTYTVICPTGQDPAAAGHRAAALAAGFGSAFGVYTGANRLRPVRLPHPDPHRRQLGRGFVLSTPELAVLAGLPTDVAVPGLARAGAKAVAPPVTVPSGGRNTRVLGVAQVGGHKVALSVPDGRHHTHIVGPTGVGKSTLLANLALADVHAGRGLVVVDPRGDLVDDILDRIPATAADRLVLLDPRQDPPPVFNPLDADDPDLAVDNLVSIFSRIYARHWGPRMDDILRAALLTLFQHANPMLTLVPPLLLNQQVRAKLTAGLHDPAGLGGFWTAYEQLPAPLRVQAIAPVISRLRALLMRSFVRTVVGQPRSSFDMRAVLDGGILLCRLPKGTLGTETRNLLGSFIVASVWQAATARADQPEHLRRDATLILDEAQNFLHLPHGIDEICAEARGYRLSLTLAHQNLTQFPRETAEAISANCRNKIYFAVSPEDARVLVKHVRPELDEHDLTHLDAYHAAARLLVDRQATPAFTLTTLPLPDPVGAADSLRRTAAAAAAAARTGPAPAIARLADLPDDQPLPALLADNGAARTDPTGDDHHEHPAGATNGGDQ
ncbi:TraM recognition domain-containing protein [Hamadaea sp. NPDC051192]|uniref:type IV secretory system conjugative DNA transfer family protein n=1 Tax=Hamadaea sp. NPDC051192 TaxID=3154940 RepID=UPI0034260724